MRIGIVSTQVPFVTGGAERHAANLATALREHGHEAAEITIPLKWYPARTLVDHILAARMLDLSAFEGAPIDLLVGLKFPAYLARHPNKIYWILHQHRQAYEMWDAGSSDLLHDADGAAVRELIHAEDRAALAGSRVFANSLNVAKRLKTYLQLPSTPLYHPPPNAEALRQGEYGDYFLAPSRVGPAKRQDLILDAFARCRPTAKLVFVGPADSEAYLQTLKDKAKRLGVADRVEWRGAVDDATLIRLYAEARAVVFAPIDEDYGYITLEAMLSARPVVTVEDAGGPLEFIADGSEGYVTRPEATALAGAMDRLLDDRDLAERLGQAGHAKYRAADITWSKVVETLTSQSAAQEAVEPASPAADPAPEIAPAPAPRAATSHAEAPCAASRAQASEPAPRRREAGPQPALSRSEVLARLAPPLPADPAFSGIDDLLAAYDLGAGAGEDEAALGDMAAYFAVHWRRYLATLALVEAEPVRRVLDVGVFPPFVFQALLAASQPGITIDGVWEGPQSFAQTVRSRSEAHPDIPVSLLPANVERDPIPYDDGSFDTVLAMEILEHFAVDPFHFMLEAARVLEPGGRLIVTTPNVVSHRGVRKALDGIAPYSFGTYIPTGGVYGRHNREFTPREVAELAEAAGFETVRLLTADVYDTEFDEETVRLLTARGDDLTLRGENILYVGRRKKAARGDHAPKPPARLYHGDPTLLSARLSVVSRDLESGRATIAITNTSRGEWRPEGEHAAELYLEWFDAKGALVHYGASRKLPEAVAPGAATQVSLTLDAGAANAAGGTLVVEMMQAGVGRYSHAGRANTVRLPCSEEAFLRLAKGR